MILLSLETATPTGGAALMRDDRVLGSLVIDEARAHSRLLLPYIEQLLREHGLTVTDLDVVAVSRGPGAFTGVRVGMALAKGLCALGDRPKLVTVSTLEALAHRAWLGMQNSTPEFIMPLLNARRGEVYGAIFRVGNAARLQLEGSEFVLPPADVVARWPGPALLAGEGAREYASAWPQDRAVHARPEYLLPHPESVAILGLEAAHEGRFEDPALAAPSYLRPVLIGPPRPV